MTQTTARIFAASYLVAALFLAIAMFVFTPFAHANAITIRNVDPGGSVATFAQWWQRVAESGDNVVIDGACISACTFFLGIVPLDRVCLTEKATLGLHMASSGDDPSVPVTQVYAHLFYPRWVQNWIAAQGGLETEIKIMYPEDVREHIALCPGSSYSDTPPEKLIAPVVHGVKE